MIGLYTRPENGESFRIDDIVRVSPERYSHGGQKVREIDFRDGGERIVSSVTVDEIMWRPLQLMPAQAGTNLCMIDLDEETGSQIHREPVIAWALCFDGEIRPVTPCGVNGARDETMKGALDRMYIELPDKRVMALARTDYTRVCATVEEQVEVLRHDRDEQLERQRRYEAAGPLEG